MTMAAPLYLHEPKARYMTDETKSGIEQTNREKYILLKEFHRTLRQALTGAEYKVFCAIEDWSESKGECWHSQSTIADACDLSIRSVNGSVKQLETLGLIECRERPGQSSTYIPAQPTYAKIAYLRNNLRKNCTGGYAKSAHLPTQNLRINVSNINGSNYNDIPTPNGVGETVPATIDLPDIVLPVSEPEREPEPEPTIPLDSRPDDTQQTHPAPPAKPASKKGKGVSVVEPGVEAKARDKPGLHAVLDVFQKEFHLLPPKRQHQGLIEAIGDAPDVITEWGKACHKWNFKGYKPTNLDGLINFYQEGNYKNDLPGRNERGRGERSDRKDRPGPANSRPSVTEFYSQSAEDIGQQALRELAELGFSNKSIVY